MVSGLRQEPPALCLVLRKTRSLAAKQRSPLSSGSTGSRPKFLLSRPVPSEYPCVANSRKEKTGPSTEKITTNQLDPDNLKKPRHAPQAELD